MGAMGAMGIFVLPLVIISLMLRERGPVATFTKAGALSPDTARRPESLKITRRYMLEGPIRRRVLVPSSGGRYWVDQQRLRTLRTRLLITTLIATIGAAAVAWYVWQQWQG